jgi:hypothetical protein
MSGPADALMASVQGGHAPSPWYESVLIGALLVVFAVGLWRIFLYLRRRDRAPKRVGDEWQALAVMGELCPHGWQAQLNLYGWGAPIPDDAPPSRVPLVELEWKQFEEESGRVAIARRVWAPSIGEALQTMVEDRRTDLALEEIEQAAEADEVIWWDEEPGEDVGA